MADRSRRRGGPELHPPFAVPDRTDAGSGFRLALAEPPDHREDHAARLRGRRARRACARHAAHGVALARAQPVSLRGGAAGHPGRRHRAADHHLGQEHHARPLHLRLAGGVLPGGLEHRHRPQQHRCAPARPVPALRRLEVPEHALAAVAERAAVLSRRPTHLRRPRLDRGGGGRVRGGHRRHAIRPRLSHSGIGLSVADPARVRSPGADLADRHPHLLPVVRAVAHTAAPLARQRHQAGRLAGQEGSAAADYMRQLRRGPHGEGCHPHTAPSFQTQPPHMLRCRPRPQP